MVRCSRRRSYVCCLAPEDGQGFRSARQLRERRPLYGIRPKASKGLNRLGRVLQNPDHGFKSHRRLWATPDNGRQHRTTRLRACRAARWTRLIKANRGSRCGLPIGSVKPASAGRIHDALQGLAERSEFLVLSQDPSRYPQIFPRSWLLGGLRSTISPCPRQFCPPSSMSPHPGPTLSSALA